MSELAQSLRDVAAGGGPVMAPLAVVLVLLWYALGSRFWTLRAALVRSARVHALRAPPGPTESVRRWLDVTFAPFVEQARRHAVLTRSLVVIAPLLGLLGTVAGMIETFDGLAQMALYTQSGGVAGGVSQALLSTQVGLVIAIPGLLLGKALDRKERVLLSELEQLKDELVSVRGHR